MNFLDKLKKFKINNDKISEKLIEIYESFYSISNLSDLDKKILAYKLHEFINGNSVTPILLTGSSGSGKNHLINNLVGLIEEKHNEKLYPLPVDCSSLARSSYVGMNQEDLYRIIEDTIIHHSDKYNKNCKFIIILDEIDKISKEAQYELLKMLDQDIVVFDGSIISKKNRIVGTLNFSKMFIIGCGAFNNKPIKSKEELINSGELIPEVIGRFSNIIRVELPSFEEITLYLKELNIEENLLKEIYEIFKVSKIGFRLLITLKENIKISKAFDKNFILTKELVNEYLN